MILNANLHMERKNWSQNKEMKNSKAKNANNIMKMDIVDMD